MPGGPVSVTSRARASASIPDTATSSPSRPTNRSAGVGNPLCGDRLASCIRLPLPLPRWRSGQVGLEAPGRDRCDRPAYPQPAVGARANLDRAGPPGEPALMHKQRFPRGMDAVVQQVASSWAGRAAGRDILHPAGVVPGAALRAIRVEDIDEFRSAHVKKPLEVGVANPGAVKSALN